MKIEQLSVFLENKPGRLASVTSVLAGHGVNIRALSMADTTDFGVLRLLTDKPKEAAQILREKGFSAQLSDVVAVEVPDQPGGLAKTLAAFNEAGLNVEYMYACVSRPRPETAIMIFRLEGPAAVLGNLPQGAGRLVAAEEMVKY